MKYYDGIIMEQAALFHKNKIPIQQAELVVVKIYRNYKYLP